MFEPVKAVSSAFEGLFEGDLFSWPALLAARHVAMNICCHPIQCCDDGTLPAAAIEPKSERSPSRLPRHPRRLHTTLRQVTSRPHILSWEVVMSPKEDPSPTAVLPLQDWLKLLAGRGVNMRVGMGLAAKM